MLTTNEITETVKSRSTIIHYLDAEPVSRKSEVWTILLWCLDTLAPILIRNGKYRKPRVWDYFKLVAFAVALIKRINSALSHKSEPKMGIYIDGKLIGQSNPASFPKTDNANERPRPNR